MILGYSIRMMVNNADSFHYGNQNHVFTIPNQMAAGFLHHIVKSQTARSILRKLSSLDVVCPRSDFVKSVGIEGPGILESSVALVM